MAGQYDRNRDAEGRFAGGGRRRSQWQEDDRYRERENYGRGAEPPRDDRGRFLSEGENGDYYGGRGYGERDYGDARGGRGRGNDYDDRGLRGREYGRGSGWYGDPQGHAEAARERWQESRGSRYEEDDDRGGRGGSFRGRERDESGRFMGEDDHGGRGGSFRGGGRERDESGRFAGDDDRGRGSQSGGGEDHRGWFGDPRGHSQAARLGWRHRQR